MAKKKDIRKLSDAQILSQITDWGLPAFRARQISEWIWKKGVTTFEEMTSLSLDMRNKLQEDYAFFPLTNDIAQHSSDGTIKMRFQLHDNFNIESVLIPVTRMNRFTVCVSSQAGCSLSCKFCATGKMGLIRQLTAAEIVDQVRQVGLLCEATYGHKLTNIVYMGMGEPLLNYKQTMESIARISSPNGLHMSPKRITVSTAGIAKMIRKLADDEVKFNLALSLHAPTDKKRNTIMAINETNTLSELMDALKYFYQKTKNRISYEYIALRDFNISDEDALDLIKLCKHFPVKVNIIEYNPIGDGMFESAEQKTVDDFAQILIKAGVMCTIRRSRGKDIDAACGQLANQD